MRIPLKKIKKEVKEVLEKRYEVLKDNMDQERDSETLKKYKILSEAYKIGKKLNRFGFTVNELASDFDIPYTTTKRVLSLDRATKKTWSLIKSGKISVFKVAMICSTKNYLFQEQVVDIVIKDKLSTYDIKKMKIRDIKDLNKFRLKKAISVLYTRKSIANQSFLHGMGRALMLLSMDYSNFSVRSTEIAVKKVMSLREKCDEFINKYLKHKKELTIQNDT